MEDPGVLKLSGEFWCLEQSIKELRAAATSSTRYHEIMLHHFDVDTSLAATLVDIIQRQKHDIKSLELSCCSGHVALVITVALSSLTILETLNVEHERDEPSTHEPIVHSIGVGLRTGCCKLKTLHLHRLSISREAAASLEEGLGGDKTLECLDLSLCDFEANDAVHALARGLRRTTRLKDVRLTSCCDRNGNSLDDSSVAHLIRGLENNQQLEKLNLNGNKCLSAGLGAVATLMDRTRIVDMDLSSQFIVQDESMDLSKLVGAIGRTSTLQSLILRFNKLSSDQNMACLAAALMHNTSIKCVDLFGNKITNSGIEIFASRVGSMRVLEKLELSQNSFDDQGGSKLAKAMEENLSIVKVQCDSKLKSFQRIQYFADLNWSGRKYAKTFSRMKPSIWPGMLSRAATVPADSASLSQQRQASILYYFLRHAPSLLFSQSQSRSSSPKKKTGHKKKEANKALHRLRSIYRDAKAIEDVYPRNLPQGVGQLPLVSNERCGSWYLKRVTTSCYFKSTDGHVNVWDFSLKRLNLPLLYNLICKKGGCIIVDSSVRKLLPDSFSRTIPIWAAVMNRIVARYAQDLGIAVRRYESWDTRLRTPAGIVSEYEHAKICERINSHVETLYRSRAIVDPERLVREMTKPIRVTWMNCEGSRYLSNDFDSALSENNFLIVCWNPSRYQVNDQCVSNAESGGWKSIVVPPTTTKNHIQWMDGPRHYYVPGAADDHESWASGLTASLFWDHHEALVDASKTDYQVERLIQSLAAGAQDGSTRDDQPIDQVSTFCDRIGNLNVWIGSRRAGRPPECWTSFDAVLNVTKTSYPSQEYQMNGKFYLQLPVEEGKRDKTELELWIPVGLLFLIHHLQQGRRVLVHCAQGKDRSAAMVLVFVCLACPLTFPLALKPDFTSWDLNEFDEVDSPSSYLDSGLSSGLVRRLLQGDGGGLFLKWIHVQSKIDVSHGPLADKESVRIALHLIRQEREVAEPARATMQKINRFLMSNSLYLGDVSKNKFS